MFFKNQSQIFDNSLDKVIPDNVNIEIQVPNNTTVNTSIAQNSIDTVETAIWQIEIPTINLVAQIADGTTTEVMNKYVGHFTETPKDSGNIGLAAHNRGYNVN